MKREYLKHKNGDLEELPMRLSMRNSAKFGNCNWKPYVYHHGHNGKLNMWYYKITKFIKSRIGKSYNEVYSEFKKKFPEYYGSINLVDVFKKHFVEYRDRNCNWRDYSYYIDENGVIQDGYVKRVKPKTAKINVRSKVIEYSFSDEVFKDKRLLDIIMTYLPGNYYGYLIQGITFSRTIYDSIKYYLTKEKVKKEITPLYSNKWFITNKGQYHCIENSYKWTGSHYVKTGISISDSGIELLIFNKHIIEDCDVVDIKSKVFRRTIEDAIKTRRSIRRKEEKQRELEREVLLYNLLQEHKKREIEENKLIRDRHGFDDESFKGEAYHGQKRKKK